MNKLDTPIEISNRFTIFGIIGIMIIGLAVRLFYFPHDLPLSLDALSYFAYGFEISQTGQFPIGVELVNNGWPMLLSVFFSAFKFDNFVSYMEVGRIASVIVSLVTVIPVYFLCRKFFTKFISLIGAAIFLIEPRIISNSVLGITEPLYVLLGTSAIVLFLSGKKWIYLSFGVLAIFSIVRYEGLLLFVPFSIMYFIRFKKENKKIIKFVLCAGIFFLILFPMAMIRMDTMGKDGFISHYSQGLKVIDRYVIQGNPEMVGDFTSGIPDTSEMADEFPGEENTNRIGPFISTGLSTLMINFGLIQIPIFIFFIPLGIVFILRDRGWKKLNHKHGILLLCFIFCLLPILYAHGRLILEFRYYLILYPLIILICLYGLDRLQPKLINKKIILIPLIFGILILSIGFLEFNKTDLSLERESFSITSQVVSMSNVVNGDSLHGNYITTANMINEWPNLKKPSDVKINKISPWGYQDIEEFLMKSKEKGLDHIVVDDMNNGPEYIQEIFSNEKKYLFLEKVFDSKKVGYDYHVKIFRINYEMLEGEK